MASSTEPPRGGAPVEPVPPVPNSPTPAVSSIPGSEMHSSEPPGTGSPVEPAVARAEPAPQPSGRRSGRAPAGINEKGRVKRTRVGAVWAGLIIAALLLILLLIFILQNSEQVPIRYFGWDGQISLGVAILFAAVVGVLLVAIPGSLRIIQLRRALVKNNRN